MYAAIDIGGTKTLVSVFSPDGEITESIKFKTPKNYIEQKTELAKVVDKLATKDFRAAVVAAPGKIDRKRGVGIVFGNLPWENVPIQRDVEQILNCPVMVENDANLAGLSEALLVRDKYNKSLYVTVSTGIGGGFIIDGKIDPNFADMEIGHILLEHNGKLQRWEEFGSGSAIVQRTGKRASEITDPSDWYMVARNIAIGLIDLIATLTPDVIIIGGGVGTHMPKYQDRLIEQLKIYENPLLKVPPVIQAKRPEEAVVYGCYDLAVMHYGKNSH